LLVIPKTLAQNGGFDVQDVVLLCRYVRTSFYFISGCLKLLTE
jgi:hypothetical protein